MEFTTTFRWLGAAGFELTSNNFTLLVDPYLTRLSLWKVFFGRATPDESAILRHIAQADAILITHSHFDHCMDVPVITKKFSCTVFGSHNTVVLLEKSGVSKELLTNVLLGDHFIVGPFRVSVVHSTHSQYSYITSKKLDNNTPAPRRALDYIMDMQLAFKIEIGNFTLLTDPGDAPIHLPDGMVLLNTLQKKETICRILSLVDASIITPIHWDNSFKAIGKSLNAPRWKILPVNSFSMNTLQKKVAALTSHGVFFIPELFRTYNLCDLLLTSRGESGHVR